MRAILSPRAEKQLKKILKIDQIAVAKKIRQIKDEKIPEKIEKLKGFADIFRVRVGNYRIVFRKDPKEIYIVLIHHRREVYRLLNQLLR